MKTIIIIIAVIITEACIYGWILGGENDQLKAENDRLKHQLAYQKDKNAELQWLIAKMDLLLAGKTAEEIFKRDEPEKQDEAEAEDDNVIYLD